MRILALSDIHANVSVVARLRERESNAYDLVIVAGDIGGRRAREICDILDTFDCPVAYVYGNHDYDLPYDFDLGRNGHHLHDRPLVVGEVCLVGFSGCPTAWGLNPIKARLAAAFEVEEQTTHAKVLADLKAIDAMPPLKRQKAREKLERTTAYTAYDDAWANYGRSILTENRAELAEALSRATRPGLFNVAITHERLTKAELLDGVDCLIHGHIHQFSHRLWRGKRHLNVAALDKPVTVFNKKKGFDLSQLSHIATGNYVTFKITNRSLQNLVLKTFGWDEDGWERSEGFRAGGFSVPTVGADPSRDREEIQVI